MATGNHRSIKATRRSVEILVLFHFGNGMYVEMRPIGRIFSSCNPIGLYQGYYRVHEKKMRSLSQHEEILSRRYSVARQVDAK